MESNVLAIGNLVYVTCYGPCWGLRGIIRDIDVISLSDAQEDPLYFYLVALHEGEVKEPVWFIHDDVAGIEGYNGHKDSPWQPSRKKPSPLEIHALEIAANISERESENETRVWKIS
jgi:hypothetical protein